VTWKAIVHSAIGTRHEQRGQPCQDYGSYRTAGPYLLGAVADGAGSAKHSDIGAEVAVESALNVLAQTFQENPDLSHAAMKDAAIDLFTQAYMSALEALQNKTVEMDCDLRDLGCTLLAFVAAPTWVAAMQIGDGFILLRSDPRASYRLLFAPDKGEFINETVFVTTPQAVDFLSVGVEMAESPFVCAATDGLERVAIRLQDWQPFEPFFTPFEACLRQLSTQDERDAYLQTFLESDRLNAKTDDDKTLLAGLYAAPSSRHGQVQEGL
jgi:hypothetical protein